MVRIPEASNPKTQGRRAASNPKTRARTQTPVQKVVFDIHGRAPCSPAVQRAWRRCRGASGFGRAPCGTSVRGLLLDRWRALGGARTAFCHQPGNPSLGEYQGDLSSATLRCDASAGPALSNADPLTPCPVPHLQLSGATSRRELH